MATTLQRLGKALLGAALAAAGVALVACGGGDSPSSSPTAAGMGTVRVALTDAPSCKVGNDDLAKVNVTVERVRIHESGDDSPMSGRWYDIDVTPARKINLLDLTNGRLEELGTLPIPSGTYTQVRLVLSPNTGNSTANSVVLLGQTAEIPLRTPSAAQSGLKIIRPFTVAPNTLVDLVIDFDACRSIVALGNGGFLLKPVLTADLRTVTAIAGAVNPLIENLMVSAQKDGKVVRSTVPASNGEFLLAYLNPSNGPYDVVVTAPSRGTSVVIGVPVSPTGVTQLGLITLPVAGTPAARTVTGTLGPDTLAIRDTGVVRALQAVAAGTSVEVATDSVDPATRRYNLLLPTAAPLVANYLAVNPLALNFSSATAVAGIYGLEGSATGYKPSSPLVPIDVSTGDVDKPIELTRLP